MRKIILIFLAVETFIFPNVSTLIDDAATLIKCGTKAPDINDLNLIAKAGKLSRVTQKSLTLSKVDNIQNLMSLSIKENRVSFMDQCKYITTFKKIKNGDKLLLKCLKNTTCDLESFSSLMTKSPLHVKVATKYPSMSLGQINIKVGTINENMMNKYFQSTGWTKIEGEVGRNGIDGLFIKKKNGVIIDVLVVESKYNKSGLQYTNHGQQMTKQWVSKKIDNLIKEYPNNSDYIGIKRYVDNDIYRAMLWNLKTQDDQLMISLKQVHDKMGKVVTSDLKGNRQMKINFNGNQEISIKNPNNDFHKEIVSWYKEEI
jgi:hypothetical protein